MHYNSNILSSITVFFNFMMPVFHSRFCNSSKFISLNRCWFSLEILFVFIFNPLCVSCFNYSYCCIWDLPLYQICQLKLLLGFLGQFVCKQLYLSLTSCGFSALSMHKFLHDAFFVLTIRIPRKVFLNEFNCCEYHTL